jgi:anti-anti-sigma regulatory factor
MTTPAFTPVFAHLGHWYVSLPVFGGPVLAVAIFVKLSQRRERRRLRAGDTTHLRVAVTNDDDRTVLSVNGALDYPALLTVESEIEAAAQRDPRVLLDLSKVTSVDVDLAWGLTEVIQAVRGAEVAVAVGPDPALEPLRKVCELEGIALVDARTAPAPTLHARPPSG